jgi:hypothetical protein
MTRKAQIAKAILSMTHDELRQMASGFIDMQKGAREDGWEWYPDKLYGEFGLIELLYCWAEGNLED